MKSDSYMNQLHHLSTGNWQWLPINLQFTSLLGSVFKMPRHKRDYWSHHCAADGTASVSQEEPHVPGAPTGTHWTSSNVSSAHAKSLPGNTSTCWVACGFSGLEDLKFSHSEHMALTPWVGEAAIQRQKTKRRCRRCYAIYHLTRKVDCFLLPGITHTKKQNIGQSHPCLHLSSLDLGNSSRARSQEKKKKAHNKWIGSAVQ